MNVNGYELVNDEKVTRATFGTMGRMGALTGGVGEKEAEENPDKLIAEYDRLGGLITKNGDKVKMGSFYDFEKKKPRETPDVKILYTVNGKVIELAEDAPLPIAVRAQKQSDAEDAEAAETAKEAKAAKKAASKKAKSADADDEVDA